MARIVAVLLIALLGCRDDSRAPASSSTGSATTEAPEALGAPTRPTRDPWASATDATVAEIACPRVTAPYFFRIEKAGKTSYLLGTRHIGVGWRKMPDAVHQALEGASLVVFETVDDDGTDDTPARAAPLREVLGPSLWARYRELAGDALADSVENGTPAEGMLMLMVIHEDRLASLELEITQRAEALAKPMRGLETSAFQQRLLDKYLDARAARAFVENIDSLDELRQDTIDDLTEYCSGTDETPGMDPKERADMKKSGYTDAEIDAMDKEMLTDRNRAWIPTLEPILAAGNAFIAVGADHTRGPSGVPALLAARGYTVVRVTKP